MLCGRQSVGNGMSAGPLVGPRIRFCSCLQFATARQSTNLPAITPNATSKIQSPVGGFHGDELRPN